MEEVRSGDSKCGRRIADDMTLRVMGALNLLADREKAAVSNLIHVNFLSALFIGQWTNGVPADRLHRASQQELSHTIADALY